jgi:hypothetical protein
MTREKFAVRVAERNARASGRSMGLPIQRLLFLTKIWRTRQPTSRPRSTARGVPPAIDWCAPRGRSRVPTEKILVGVGMKAGVNAE